MGLNAIIGGVRAGWGAYRALGTVSKAHPEYALVVRDLPQESLKPTRDPGRPIGLRVPRAEAISLPCLG